MKFTRETPSAIMIRSVDAQGIQIGEIVHENTIALVVDKVLENWTDKDVAELEENDFSELLDASPEVIVLGTGKTNVFPHRELVFAMARRRVGFEVMDTAAAARTYNVLAGEGRQVAAVLYL
jgi:uncharacterized protein